MSLLCNCPRCGGDDEFAMCENALLNARVDVAKSENKKILLLSFGIFMFGLCLSISVSYIPESPIVEVQSIPLKPLSTAENQSTDPAKNWEYID